MAKEKRISGKSAALKFIEKHAGEQVAIKDAIAAALNTKGVSLRGATPAATIAAALYTEAAKPDGLITKVDRGMVAWRTDVEAKPRRRASRKESA